MYLSLPHILSLSRPLLRSNPESTLQCSDSSPCLLCQPGASVRLQPGGITHPAAHSNIRLAIDWRAGRGRDRLLQTQAEMELFYVDVLEGHWSAAVLKTWTTELMLNELPNTLRSSCGVSLTGMPLKRSVWFSYFTEDKILGLTNKIKV